MKLHRRKFIGTLGLGAAGLGLGPGLREIAWASESHPAGGLARSTPEAQGVASAAILDFLDAIAGTKHEFHSFMMVRHGNVIAEGWWAPYRPAANHMLYSLSKSFTSTAAGFAVTGGRMTVEDPVISFFPEKLPRNVSANLAALKVKHLLTMSAGHATDTTHTITEHEDWVESFLALPIDHPPGSVFLYNSGATFMVSAIVQKVTGQKVIDYLRPRLFEPLHIEGMTWETSPLGINTGGWGLAVPTEALAKFGQFLLQDGEWEGRQLLPASWIHEATTFKIQQPAGKDQDLAQLKVTSEWHQGYCYQFWRCRHNAFRGDGAFGQFMIVMPQQDTVVVITSQTPDMPGEIKLVWDHLLPGIKETPLPEDKTSQSALARKLHSLALSPAQRLIDSSSAYFVSGKVFEIEPNNMGVREVEFKLMHNRWKFYLTDQQGRYEIDCGLGHWVDGICNMPGTPPKITVGNLRPCKVAASAGWQTLSLLEMIWRYYETPHHDTVLCDIDGDSVRIEFQNSIPGHAETRPVLSGRLKT